MPFNLGVPELIIISVLIVFVFGAKRLPEMGKSIGLGIREFKKSLTQPMEEEKETTDSDSKIEDRKEAEKV